MVQLVIVLVIALIGAVWRFYSFRMRYAEGELVIRTGIFRRNERHIPYSRIQSVDSRRNAFHQMFGVVDVVIQTAGGDEPEAKLSVLPASAIDEIRARVFGSRAAAERRTDTAPETNILDSASDSRETLLRLSTRELLLYGFIENRGMILVLAAVGVMFEVGPYEGMIDNAVNAEFGEQGPLRGFVTGLFTGAGLPMWMVLYAAIILGAILLLARMLSVVWAAIRLHDFTVSRVGNDLRVEYGLFTRVAGTVPMDRITTVSVRAGLAHRLFARATLNVTVARGGPFAKGGGVREPLIPILRESRVNDMLRELWPDLDLEDAVWKPLHPRAHVRFLRVGIVGAALISVILSPALRLWAFAVFALLTIWQLLTVKKLADSINWTLSGKVFAARRGWLTRYKTLAWLNKVQVVALSETFFDRRNEMARVSASTSGGAASVSYISRDAAVEAFARLTAIAARTKFRL